MGTTLVTGRTPSIRLLGVWMSAVADLVRAVNAAKPLDELLERIAEQACRLIGFDFCAVMLADPTRTWLHVRGSHGLPPDYVAVLNREHTLTVKPGRPDDDTVTARAFREAVTLTVRDIAGADGYGATRRWAQLQGFGALLATPLLGPGGPAGVVVAYSRVAREFTGSEIELVELLAQHAVLALETADLRAVQQETIAELEHKRQLLEAAEVQHRRLMQLLLDEAGLSRLAESLSEALLASITIEDVDDTVLAVAPAGTTTPAPSARERRRPPVRAALRSLHERYEVTLVEPVGWTKGPAWVAPVVIGGQLVGRLWGTGIAAPPDAVERRMIERFALVVAAELLRRRYRIDTENRVAGDLVDELLRTTPPHIPPSTLERAAALGHDLACPQVLAVFTADTDVQRLADAVRSGLFRSARPLVGTHNGTLVVILAAEPDPVPVLSAVHERIVALTGVRRVVTVLGPPVTGIGFGAAFSVAAGAAQLCPAEGTNGVLDLRELGLAAHLLRVGTTAELRSFVDALVGPLEEYDDRRGAQLCATVRAWLAAGCSVPAAARDLTLHPNTVAYRLARAEQLLGRDVRATATRMELQLAFTVRDVERAAPRP